MDKAFYRCLIFPLLTFVLCLTSCNEEDCLSDQTSLITIQFVDIETNIPAPQAFRINIEGYDAILSSQTGPESSVFALPINPHSDQITYIFTTAENNVDHISFTYSRIPRVLSSECPYEIQYKNLQIEQTTFPDSLQGKPAYKLNKNELKISEIPNVTIYR